MKKIQENLGVIFIFVSSFIIHFIFFGYPAQTVFDEVHFGKFISGYFSGEYFFDIHPPLAKLLITGVGIIGGYRPAIGFGMIGESFTDTNFIWLRLLPTLAGALLPLVIYYLCRILNLSKFLSFTAAFLVILENSLLVHSRFILLDSLLLLFGFGSLLLYFLYQKYIDRKKSLYFLLLSLLFASFALSIKWTGVSFFALICGLEFINCKKNKAEIKEYLGKACFFFIIPFLVYFLTFGIHFVLLQKTGPGEDFMSDRFQKTLIGNTHEKDEDTKPLGLWGKFLELNAEMWRSNKRLDSTHPYGSLWYTWPIMKRPIYYWVENKTETVETISKPKVEEVVPSSLPTSFLSVQNNKTAKIYLLGNPFIYWIGSLGILLFLFYIAFHRLDREKDFEKKKQVVYFLLIGYFLNLLPFMFIGRVMFLYHYFASLIFSIIILAFLIDEIKLKKTKKRTAILLLLISLLGFVYFIPLSYGLPLSRPDQEARFWFKSWE